MGKPGEPVRRGAARSSRGEEAAWPGRDGGRGVASSVPRHYQPKAVLGVGWGWGEQREGALPLVV